MDGGEIILLSLKSNKISQIHPGSLGRRYLEKLQVLDLSDNEITYLPSIDFSVRLSNLSLAHNPLKTIDYKFEPISIVQLSNSNLRCGCSIYSLSIVISKGTVLLNPDGKENVCSYNTDNNDLKNSSKKSITKNLPNKAIKSLINDKFLSDNCSDQINIVNITNKSSLHPLTLTHKGKIKLSFLYYILFIILIMVLVAIIFKQKQIKGNLKKTKIFFDKNVNDR
ncbi:unnamed protein product [Gordionus sp. m RMFG-2023]